MSTDCTAPTYRKNLEQWLSVMWDCLFVEKLKELLLHYLFDINLHQD